MSYDHIKLRSRIEALQKSQRNLMGEQLDSLTLGEVQQLEQQIGNALRNIRSRKNHLFLNSIKELRKKESLLMDQNSILEKVKLICSCEKEKAELEASMHKNGTASSTEAAAPICNAAAAFLPNLNIWPSNRSGGSSGEPATAPLDRTSSYDGLPWSSEVKKRTDECMYHQIS